MQVQRRPSYSPKRQARVRSMEKEGEMQSFTDLRIPTDEN